MIVLATTPSFHVASTTMLAGSFGNHQVAPGISVMVINDETGMGSTAWVKFGYLTTTKQYHP